MKWPQTYKGSSSYVGYMRGMFVCDNSLSHIVVDLNEYAYNKARGVLPLIFCIHVRSGPIYWGGGYLPCKRDYKVMVFYM